MYQFNNDKAKAFESHVHNEKLAKLNDNACINIMKLYKSNVCIEWNDKVWYIWIC